MSDARIDFYTNRRLIPDDARLKFGTGNDAELVWSTADADNHSLVLALGDSNQALHVTDVGAVATDWNVAADTHPALYLHSNTTPATDYLKIGGHDGASATIDLVGGTTLKIAFDGSAEIDISATGFSPSIDGGNALGTTSLGWNGLHLNTGTAINWENGDVTLTHAAGKVTWGGDGAVEIDFNNHEMTNVDINSGAIDGTTVGASVVATVKGSTGQFTDTTAATSTTAASLKTAGGIATVKGAVIGGAFEFGSAVTNAKVGFRRGNIPDITTAKTIDDQRRAIYYISGEDAGGGANRFFDMLIFDRAISSPITPIHQQTFEGSPAARTYTRSGDNLQIALASGTYDISYFGIVLADPT